MVSKILDGQSEGVVGERGFSVFAFEEFLVVVCCSSYSHSYPLLDCVYVFYLKRECCYKDECV